VAARHPGGEDPAPLAAPPLPGLQAGGRQAPPENCGSVEEFLALRQQWPPVLIAARMAEILADILDADGDGGTTPWNPPAALRAPDPLVADTPATRRAHGPDSPGR